MAAKKDDTAAPAAETAVEAEATGVDTVEHEYKGYTYTVPATVDDWPLGALRAARNGDPLGVLETILGDEQFAVFETRNGTVRDLRKFSEEVSNLSGFTELGN